MPPDLPLHFGSYRLEVAPWPVVASRRDGGVAAQGPGRAVAAGAPGRAGGQQSDAARHGGARDGGQRGDPHHLSEPPAPGAGRGRPQPRYIATVHRLGYRFVAPVTPRDPPPPWRPRPPCTALARPRAPAAARGSRGGAGPAARLVCPGAAGRTPDRLRHGEAGMGKTTLVDAFLAEVAAAQTAWIGRGQCIDHSGAGEAYLPLLDALRRLGRGPAGARLVACVRQYAPTWLGQLPPWWGRRSGGPSCIRGTG